MGISHVKTSCGISDRVAVVIDFVETASAISRCMDGRGSGIVITSAEWRDAAPLKHAQAVRLTDRDQQIDGRTDSDSRSYAAGAARLVRYKW